MLAGGALRAYEDATAAALTESDSDPALRARYSSSLWLHQVYHSQSSAERKTPQELLAFEPVARFLVPAALEFLEARRSCPVVALSHAELADLDFLMAKGDSSAVYLDRADRLAGFREPTLALIAQIGLASNDAEVVKSLRSQLAGQPVEWTRYADIAAALLPPDKVLERIVPDGKHAVLLAERLYNDPEDAEVRKQFCADALRRLPFDPRLDPDERLELEARAHHGLGEHDKASLRMMGTLRYDPGRTDRRKQLIEWLIAEGKPDEAHG